MKLYERLTGKDKGKLFAMWLITILAGVVINVNNRADVSKMAVTLFFASLFFVAFVWMLVQDFTIDESRKQLHDVLAKALVTYVMAVIITLSCYVLPWHIHGMLCVSVLLCVTLPPIYGLSLSLLLSILLGLNRFSGSAEVAYIVFLCVMGCLLTPVLSRKVYRIFAAVIMGCLSVTAGCLFGYLEAGKLTIEAMLTGGAEGILNILVVLLGVPLLQRRKQMKDSSSCEKALEEDFPLAGFLRSLSEKRYRRCQFVSKVCRLCARQVGFDEELCACGGFYYDLCDNDEPDAVEYATNLGKRNQLPIDVVRILSQYHGQISPIVTREAALVDLVYETVLSLERLNDDAENFEKEMSVHTVFNNLSKNGRYDVSGLSMNQFLTLRNFLIKEVDLL